MLQREISSLSSCSMAKERESIRKELEKTKIKLKDMEFKLKNAVQEKTKLEVLYHFSCFLFYVCSFILTLHSQMHFPGCQGEKSCAERELKRLQSQRAVLERDMSKRESIIGRRRDSTIDRSSNVFDQKRAKGSTSLAELEVVISNCETNNTHAAIFGKSNMKSDLFYSIIQEEYRNQELSG